jgi:hypothetical protein
MVVKAGGGACGGEDRALIDHFVARVAASERIKPAFHAPESTGVIIGRAFER